MSDPDALLAAVCAAPDDDLPRLVYADWLDETGDPVNADRAAFIRLQLALEAPDLPADQRAAMQRETDELLRKREAEWLGPVAGYVEALRQQATSIGRIDYRDVCWSGIDVTWARGWVYRVCLRGLTAEMLGAAAKAPILRAVQEVDLFEFITTFSDDNLMTVLRSVHSWPLRHFGAQSGTGNGVAIAVIESGIIDRIKSLDLSSNQLDDNAAEALARYPGTARLESLRLWGNYLTIRGRRALAAVGHRKLGSQWSNRRTGTEGFRHD